MFKLFKKPVKKEPKYTKEGIVLYTILQDKDDWSLDKGFNTNHLGLQIEDNYIVHKSGIRVRCSVWHALEVRIDKNGESSSKIFSADDRVRVMPLISEIEDSIRNKPIREKLLSVVKSKNKIESNCER